MRLLKDVSNPWMDVSWKNTIAGCDLPYITSRYGSPNSFVLKSASARLTFDALPEPFSGDVNSMVYCLNMNPGEPDASFSSAADVGREYEYQSQLVLSHKTNRHFFTGMLYDGKVIYDNLTQWETQLDSIFKSSSLLKDFRNPTKKNSIVPRPHAGAVWQRQIMNPLRKLLKRDPNVFFVEYFPYHSKYSFKFPADLPSYGYRNYLIKKAMCENKLIIIMRMENLWYKAIPELEYYPNKLLLKTKRCVWLSMNNFCRDIPYFRNCCSCQTVNDILKMF